MTNIRRLSAEMRQREKDIMTTTAGLPTPQQYLCALEDLDVADAEIINRDETIHCLRESVKELQTALAQLQSGIDNELCDIRLDREAQRAEIHHLQQKCEKIPALMAEAEAHRTMLMERDALLIAGNEKLADLEAQISALRDAMVGEDHVLWDKALENTDQTALVFVARIRADERRQVLEEVRGKWLALSSAEWARWLQLQVEQPEDA